MIAASFIQVQCKTIFLPGYNNIHFISMVCSVENGRMAVMTRLLAGGRLSRTIADEVGHQKLASEFICRELRDADEANLIDEEDMHVFGLKPMTDPLHLVCCNNCKKPVRASQYIIHAEHCRSVCYTQGTIVDLDGAMEHRKHPRKEKKKLLPADANILALEKERSEPLDADCFSAPALPINNQFGIVQLTKGNSTCDGSGVFPSFVDRSSCLTFPSTKRSKLITSEGLLLASDLEPSSAKTKIKNVPFPLASKIYYSQRNNRLRSALGYLYWEAVASSKEICDMKENINRFHNSSQETSLEQMNDILRKKMDSQSLCSAWKPDHNFAQSLDIVSIKPEKSLPAIGAANKIVVRNVGWPQVAPIELAQ